MSDCMHTAKHEIQGAKYQHHEEKVQDLGIRRSLVATVGGR